MTSSRVGSAGSPNVSYAISIPLAGAICSVMSALLELQRFGFQVLLEPEAPQLAPVPGLLEAAERGQRVERTAVDLHLAGAYAPGHALGAFGVSRPHPGGQPVDGVVGDRDRLLLAVVGHDRQHRPED